MRNVVISLIIGVMTALGAAGCDGGGASCESRCEAGKTHPDMCVPASTDCAAACATAEEQEAAARMLAERAGCASEFNAAIACADGLETCETGCSTENNALSTCITTFCTANPGDC